MSKKVVIIGGGAAGFFSAINVALKNPSYHVSILEKTNKLLSKVKVSGGGRCNVTNNCLDIFELVKNYPRGQKELVQVFNQFNVSHTIDWFQQHGVKLKTEPDNRMFPITNDSQTIIDCFLQLAQQLKIEIITSCQVLSISKKEKFILKTNLQNFEADAVICAYGGHNKAGSYDVIKNLGHTIVEPIPSLFTFNLPQEKIKKELQGISVAQAKVSIATTKLFYTGPLLITHWGLSGPAVLKLSAFAAKLFHESNYNSEILVNWVYPFSIEEIEQKTKALQKEKHKALPYSNAQFDLPKRLWEFLCNESGIDNSKIWAEINNKQIKLLAHNLCNSKFKMEGKTTFKEEFVTAGGVSLKEIDFKTMQSKVVTNLFFCGEVLNLDGITGGFNFQAAWSTAWVCAQSI